MVILSKLAVLALPVAILGASAGCEKVVKPPTPSQPLARLPIASPKVVDRQALPAVVRAINALAFDLDRRTSRGSRGNRLASPACVSAGLSLILAGANGDTAAGVARAIHLPNDLADPSGGFGALVESLNADGPSHQIRLANAFWVDRGYPIGEAYRRDLRDHFAVEDFQVDFRRADEAARTINDWTTRRTGGRLGPVVGPGDIPPNNRLMLTTALHFRCSWRHRFRVEKTKIQPFRVDAGRSVDVPMMNLHSYAVVHGYLDEGSYQVLTLPCGRSGEYEMAAILPRDRDGLAAVEASLTPEVVESWWPRIGQPEEIIIGLPRFRVESSVDLGSTLDEMGMKSAFGDRADFSSIAGPNSGLRLATVRHAARIDVDEEGIEAAGALIASSPDAFGDEPPVFRADHPFAFLIRDVRTGCILFMGRVVDPTDSSGGA